MNSSAQRNLSGKIYDPAFLCMVGAIVLAIGSSIALRAMTGPSTARAAEISPNTALPVDGTNAQAK